MKKKRLSYSIKDNGYELSPAFSNKKIYTYEFRCPDILLTEDKFRDHVMDSLTHEFRLSLQNTLFGGCWGWGSSKELKNSMKKIGKKRLEKLDYDDFKFLKDTGMLWEFYPEAPDNWEDIDKRNKR